MFIATGQDVANVSESHAGVVYNQLLDNGNLYWSITLTSLIVATYGGGCGFRFIPAGFSDVKPATVTI
jgi:hydroxymethylglutaryl-CoA reductase (NADPH)